MEIKTPTEPGRIPGRRGDINMNIYEKMQEARVKLHEVDMKKSGNNKFVGYQYFELGDFLPHITRIFAELKLFSMIGFDDQMATLTIVNAEKPEEAVVFTSPMSTAALKGCHDVQNLGAVQTYLRRYLYVNALEIVEHDPLDATTGNDTQKTPAEANKATKQTKKEAKNGLTLDEREAMIEGIIKVYREQKKNVTDITAFYKVPILEDLTDEQLQQAYKKVVG